MVRLQAAAPAFLLLALGSTAACSANRVDPTASRPAHPLALPDDFVVGETAPGPPPPPPNIDGNLPGDAGLTLADAVPFFDGQTRQGRIGDDDDGDAWIVQGDNGDTFTITVQNDDADHPLSVHLRNADSHPVVVPAPLHLEGGHETQFTIELSRLVATQTLLVVVQADDAIDYRLTIRSE